MIELTIGLLVLAIIFAVIFGRNARQKRERAAEAARKAVEARLNRPD
ncbi:MAG: hypothetical protein HLUCCA04_00210 [Oceanicaulis sp. HLUCCA04]|nr:MAG: hypothetical protein HLUCCA04_00210 [Oceanicaulis sp. HLUCCA04]